MSKPGIIYGNVMTGAAGFLFAGYGHFRWEVFAATLLGISLIIGSACATNNYTDRNIDKIMARTRKRPLPSGQIAGWQALTYAAVLAVLGFGLLLWRVPVAVSVIGGLAWIDYVILYGWSKRKSEHGTLVGSLCGSAPILGGYVAATGRFDTAAWLLFLVMVAWQMAHFYGIALYRQKDYAAAGIPVLPVARNARVTRYQTLSYIVAFGLCNILLWRYGHAGVIYLVVLSIVSLWWLVKALREYALPDDGWGRSVFLFSLIVLLAMSAMLAVNPFIS